MLRAKFNPNTDVEFLTTGDLVVISIPRAEKTSGPPNPFSLARVGSVVGRPGESKVGLLFVWPASGKVETGMYDPACIMYRVGGV